MVKGADIITAHYVGNGKSGAIHCESVLCIMCILGELFRCIIVHTTQKTLITVFTVTLLTK